MPKVVVDCGNCGPDYGSIRQMIQSNFDAVVLQTHGLEDTLQLLAERDVDLITVNRKLDRDYSDGMDVIRQLKTDERSKSIPVMLVTNYEEHQQAAIDIGAVRGFGKLSVKASATVELLVPYIGPAKSADH